VETNITKVVLVFCPAYPSYFTDGRVKSMAKMWRENVDALETRTDHCHVITSQTIAGSIQRNISRNAFCCHFSFNCSETYQVGIAGIDCKCCQ